MQCSGGAHYLHATVISGSLPQCAEGLRGSSGSERSGVINQPSAVGREPWHACRQVAGFRGCWCLWVIRRRGRAGREVLRNVPVSLYERLAASRTCLLPFEGERGLTTPVGRLHRSIVTPQSIYDPAPGNALAGRERLDCIPYRFLVAFFEGFSRMCTTRCGLLQALC